MFSCTYGVLKYEKEMLQTVARRVVMTLLLERVAMSLWLAREAEGVASGEAATEEEERGQHKVEARGEAEAEAEAAEAGE